MGFGMHPVILRHQSHLSIVSDVENIEVSSDLHGQIVDNSGLAFCRG